MKLNSNSNSANILNSNNVESKTEQNKSKKKKLSPLNFSKKKKRQDSEFFEKNQKTTEFEKKGEFKRFKIENIQDHFNSIVQNFNEVSAKINSKTKDIRMNHDLTWYQQTLPIDKISISKTFIDLRKKIEDRNNKEIQVLAKKNIENSFQKNDSDSLNKTKKKKQSILREKEEEKKNMIKHRNMMKTFENISKNNEDIG